jgi:aryl-alcohol dehydrogenase-like predicted oxidoreductase
MRRQLKRLGIDHIDLWQMRLRRPDPDRGDDARAGRPRSGRQGPLHRLSNFSGWHLMKAQAIADRHGWTRHVAHQLYYSLLAREYEWELMPLAVDQKVGAVVWSPLSGGRLSGKLGRNRVPGKDTRHGQIGTMGPEFPQDQLYDIVDVLYALAEETGRTVPQVALNWVLRRPTVSTVIVGARNEAQLKENLGAVDFALTPEQVARLDAASHRPPIYPYWHQRRTSSDRNPPLFVK